MRSRRTDPSALDPDRRVRGVHRHHKVAGEVDAVERDLGGDVELPTRYSWKVVGSAFRFRIVALLRTDTDPVPAPPQFSGESTKIRIRCRADGPRSSAGRCSRSRCCRSCRRRRRASAWSCCQPQHACGRVPVDPAAVGARVEAGRLRRVADADVVVVGRRIALVDRLEVEALFGRRGGAAGQTLALLRISTDFPGPG